MRSKFIGIVTIFVMVCAPSKLAAKTANSEKSIEEQRELKNAHNERIKEFEEFEAQNDIERELNKKRNAQWKKEQAKLTAEFRTMRAQRLSQIEEEKEKEMASRTRQKELRAQMDLEESDHKAKLAKKRMEILYGAEVDSNGAGDFVESHGEQKKPFWEEWLEPKN